MGLMKGIFMNQSKKKPRTFKPEFKLNIVLEAFATGNFAGTAAKHGIHISQINNWKKQLLVSGAEIFKSSRVKKSHQQSQLDELKRIIGDLTIENQILKKTAELLS
jgi:transposase-like protein